MNIILGIISGVGIAIVFFMLTVPLYVGLLTNKPGGRRKSGFHMFTFPEEGKVKIIVRGDVVIRMIMLYAGHHFERDRTRADREHWEIKDSPPSESPLAGIWLPIKPWAWYVYNTTGAVFTGLWPFQKVREYLMERTKIIRFEADGKSNIHLVVEEDYSDHFRAREFLFPFRVAQADTQDKISVNGLFVLRAKVHNPHKAAFAVDRWDQQLSNLATNAVTNFTRTRTLDSVLTAQDSVGAGALNDAVMAIQRDEEHYGIEITGVDIIDISPNLTDSEKEKLYAEALAKPVGRATIIDGETRASALRAINEANKDGGEHAIETMRAEALVRAAEAAKNGTVILPAGGASGNDPVQAAILDQLKKLNQSQSNEATDGTE